MEALLFLITIILETEKAEVDSKTDEENSRDARVRALISSFQLPRLGASHWYPR
jgi:hypothetical protein